MIKAPSEVTAKVYLSQAYRTDLHISAMLMRVSQLRELATKASATLSDMPRPDSPNLQPMESIVLKLVDTEERINASIDTLVNFKEQLANQIYAMENEDYRALLELRYICFKTWVEIARMMKYDIRWVYRLHDKALMQFAKDYGCVIPKKAV